MKGELGFPAVTPTYDIVEMGNPTRSRRLG
jgi:hypothetical protein